MTTPATAQQPDTAAAQAEPQTGACMYCGATDVPIVDGYLKHLHRMPRHATEDGLSMDFCKAPMHTVPGTLHDRLNDILGHAGHRDMYGTPRHPQRLLEEVAQLKRNCENAEKCLDELGVGRGGYARLSVTGRIGDLVKRLKGDPLYQ